jgi:hypothetical protein
MKGGPIWLTASQTLLDSVRVWLTVLPALLTGRQGSTDGY